MEFSKKVSPEEEVHDNVTAGIKAGGIRGPLARLDALYKRVRFNITASFGLLRKAVAGRPELAQFVIFRTPTDYSGLIKTKEEFHVGKQAFFSDQVEARAQPLAPKKTLQRPEPCAVKLQKLEEKVTQLAGTFDELSIFVIKQFQKAGPAAATDGRTGVRC